MVTPWEGACLPHRAPFGLWLRHTIYHSTSRWWFQSSVCFSRWNCSLWDIRRCRCIRPHDCRGMCIPIMFHLTFIPIQVVVLVLREKSRPPAAGRRSFIPAWLQKGLSRLSLPIEVHDGWLNKPSLNANNCMQHSRMLALSQAELLIQLRMAVFSCSAMSDSSAC
jgi:hypothetical protein